jgi:DNA-binding response OmpR family regulator
MREDAPMKKRVLSISYDDAILKTRQLILEQAGFEIVSAWGFSNAMEYCEKGDFDVVLIGHSLPPDDKTALVKVLRRHCDRPVISVRRSGQHTKHPAADYSIAADDGPEALVKVVKEAAGT